MEESVVDRQQHSTAEQSRASEAKQREGKGREVKEKERASSSGGYDQNHTVVARILDAVTAIPIRGLESQGPAISKRGK